MTMTTTFRLTLARAALTAALTATLSLAPGAAASATTTQGATDNTNASAAAPLKVLRYAFPSAETGFDPVRVSDLYSRTVTPHIFEGLYHYDHLARPYKIKPLTAAGMPEVSADFRVWTVRLKPGIYFADDPAFKGKKRELVAADYVYTFKRFFDPANLSPTYSGFNDAGVIGVNELREETIKTKKPFDYDREVEGLKVLDRYTLQFKLKVSRPGFLETLASGDLFNGMAREVVEFYGDKIMEHPVGTGPFMLKADEWRRSALIVLVRNPAFRDMSYDAEPNADDAAGQALLARFKGRKLPMIDRVEISIIEENQPRWLAYLQGQLDLMERLPLDYAPLAVPNGKLAPNLAKRGMTLSRVLGSDVTLAYFNMEDPVVGGYTPDKVALRRAIGLAFDVDREIRLVRRGQAVAAQSMYTPNTYGYDPDFRSNNSEFDLAKARALLDMYGYHDRDRDGWREQPDGNLLALEYASQPDQISRQFDELWMKSMTAIGIRLKITLGQWPEQMKAAQAGKLQMWELGSSADTPDGADALQRVYGPAAGGQNIARFKNADVDRMYQQVIGMPNGPERLELMQKIRNIVLAYAPYHYKVHRMINDISQPWFTGYKRPVFWTEWWQYVDIDSARQLKEGSK